MASGHIEGEAKLRSPSGPCRREDGRRIVTLPAVVVEALAEHMVRYPGKSPEAFVFLSSQGKHLRRSSFNRRVWQLNRLIEGA